jgi:DNA-binding NtrC family response regulator
MGKGEMSMWRTDRKEKERAIRKVIEIIKSGDLLLMDDIGKLHRAIEDDMLKNIRERDEMILAGYPLCLTGYDWPGNYGRHCRACITRYRASKESTHITTDNISQTIQKLRRQLRKKPQAQFMVRQKKTARTKPKAGSPRKGRKGTRP